MVNNPNDIGFIHDIASLDTLRKQAVTVMKIGKRSADSRGASVRSDFYDHDAEVDA